MSKPRPISSHLSPCEHLLAHTRQLKRLQVQLERLIAPDLHAHIRIQNLRRGSLILQADSPIWANRLRYLLPALNEQLGSIPGLEGLREVKVVISPPQPRPASPVRAPKLSASTIKLLLETADACDDPQLGEAFKRLADNVAARQKRA